MRRRVEDIVDAMGRLRPEVGPAIYLDSSVLCDYWLAEGLEGIDPSRPAELTPEERWKLDLRRLLARLAGGGRRLELMGEIRRQLLLEVGGPAPVTSSLAVLELIQWHARANLMQIIGDEIGVLAAIRKGQKDVGSALGRLADMATAQIEQLGPASPTTPIQHLSQATWLNDSFAEYHGLKGVAEVDVRALTVSHQEAWELYSVFAYLQVGLADILHVAAARHLGCRYFASFDTDFRRVRDRMKADCGLELLCSPEELLKVVQGNGNT